MDINWSTQVITVYKTDLFMSLVAGDIYDMDTAAFRLALTDLEDSEIGITMPVIQNHNSEVLLGGIAYARIIEIINGYTITFDDTGGAWVCNLLGSNNNILDVTNLTSVQVRSNNSAGLINVKEIQQSAFQGFVWLDSVTGVDETIYPAGTPTRPVNNIAAAQQICEYRGFKKIFLLRPYVLPDDTVLDEYLFQGISPSLTVLTLSSAANVGRCQFTSLHITGSIDNDCTFRQCEIHDLLLFRGYLLGCSIHGTLGLGGGVEADILSCYAGHADEDVIVDMGGSGQNASFRAWSGKLKITNMTDASVTCAVDMIGGEVEVDFTTVTAGNIACQGNGEVKDSVSGDMLVHAWYGDVYIDNYAMNGRFQQEMWQGFGLDKNHPEQVGRFSKIIANAVWDEAVADHSDAEATFGRTLKHLGHIPKSIYFDGDIVYADRALPPELLTNGDLFNDDYWIADAGWRIQNGEAYANVADDTALLTHPIMLANGGQQYIYKFTIKEYESGQVRLHADGGDGAWHTGNGTFSLVVTPSFSSTYIALQGHPTEGFKGEISEVSLRKYGAFNGNGKEAYPFNNLGDALDIYETFGFNWFVVKSDIVIDRNLKNIKVDGIGTPEVDANGFDLKNSEFHRIRFKGDYIDSVIVQESVLLNGAYLNGFFENCAVAGSVTVKAASTTYVKNCASMMPNGFTPNFFIGDDANVNITEWYGKIRISGCSTANSSVILNVGNGEVFIDSSCTNGTILITGNCVVDDQSNGSTVTNHALNPLAGGSLTTEQNTKLTETWQRLGLDAQNPVTNQDDGGYRSGDITVVGSELGSSIVQTRQ